MINLEDLDVLKDKIVYATSDDKYVVYEDGEDVLNVVNYSLLGFQNGYTYANAGGYLVKSTSAGAEIARLNLDVEHGVFKENFTYIYFYTDRTIYKIKENMLIDWELTFDDYIRAVIMDNYGSIYILFKNSRAIRKYSNTGEYILYLNESDDPTTYCRLYTGFVSEGSGHLYVIGTMFYDNKCKSFIDHYDVRKAKLIDREILCEYKKVKLDDEYFTYKDLYIDGDYVYVYANNYIEKLNLKMRSIWRYGFGYNYTTNTSDYLNQIVFDDKKFHDRIYFCENFDTSNGYSFGKLSTNGNLLWKLTNPEGITKSDFNVCVYRDQMYIVCKRNVEAKASYVLALDNNRVLFETREGHLVRVVQDNYDEIYSPESYSGKTLLGDSLKEGVSKFLSSVLLYDYGEIMADDENYLLVREKNKDLRNPENYDYFKLVGSESLDEANSVSRLVTMNGNHILTMNNSYIDTLYPYTPDLTNQYIVTPEGDYIDTNDDKHLIRSRGMYTEYFVLLADLFNYHQDIISKKKGLTLLTKKKHFSIRKKKKSVYRYVVKKLLDIDIIVEHLQQNGVLETLVPKYVDKLRHHTTHMIRDMQEAKSPTYFNLGATKRYSYIYDGYEYPLRVSATQIFMCKNIPFIKKKTPTKSIYIEKLDKLIANEMITPFMLFLNGRAIKWSNVTVVNDWNFVYLIITNSKDESEKLEAVMFPCTIRYGEDNNILSSNKKNMYFTSEGVLTNDTSNIGIRVEILDKEVNGTEKILSSSTDYVEVPVSDTNQVSAVNNIFVFEDGLFFGDSRFYLDDHGKNIYTYARNTKPTCKVFYFNNANDSKNMIYSLPNQPQARENIVDKIENSSSVPTDNFMVPFDFKLSRDKSYLRNISEATRYILTYNMSLLVDYYRDQSNIKSFTFTGERIKTLSAKNGGYLVMPRQMNNGCFDYIMVFKNDELYDYYNEIEYLDKEFRIPVFTHIQNEDTIEILHFKNVINDISHLIVSTTPDYIQEELRYNNFLLFSNSPSGKGSYDKYSVELKTQYPVEFSYKNNFNDGGKYVNTSISLEDSYFAGKELNICSKRQFHAMYYNIITEGIKEFPLTNEFKFCQNSNQYMIFVNNKKLNFSDWSYVIENNGKADIPKIKTNTGLKVGDRICIFYIPDPYEEIVLTNHLNSFGDIIIDASQLDYSFDSDLFMIFIDGKKVCASDIQNISMNRVRVKTDYPEYSNVTVCKYLNPDALLEKVFSYGDIWSNAVESLSKDQYDKLFIKAGVVK